MNLLSPSPSGGSLPLVAGWREGLDPAVNYTWTSIACLIAFLIYVSTRLKRPYDGIPAVGRTGFLSSYIDAMRGLKHSEQVMQEGYDRYYPGTFRIPELNRWHVIVTGGKLMEEFTKAPDDTFSLMEAAKDTTAVEYTLGPNLSLNPYHLPIVRGQLTRNLSNLLDDVREEIALAFANNIPVSKDWKPVKVLNAMMKIVSQTSNRVFVGAPTCREPEYIELNVQFAREVVIGANIIGLFPIFLKPFAGRYFTSVPKSIKTILKHLRPIIDKRQQHINEYGLDYPDKPVDMLSWLMDEAQGQERTAESLANRILMLNFAAIHATSATFTYALFELASHPEYVDPIRKEVETVVREHGWSKVAMTRMRKLDSFLKESHRLKGLSTLSMSRKALRDFTFSDGTRIPKGALVSALMLPRHKDNDVYPDSSTFKGFRFSDIREEKGEETKNQMVTTSLDYLSFGHGRHACPGRFFAVFEMKILMAHVVLRYDMKMSGVTQVRCFGHSTLPDHTAEVMFKERGV